MGNNERCWTIFEPRESESPGASRIATPGRVPGEVPGYERIVVVPESQLRGAVRAIEEIAAIDPQAFSPEPALDRLQSAVAIAMAARARFGGR